MELDLFDEPKNQVAVDRIFYTETRPMSNFTSPDVSTVDFFVSGQGPEYMDLKRSRLYVRAKLIKADGTTFDDEDTSSIVNLPLQAMWSQMDVYMNNKLVSLNTSNYPWKAYLKTILTSGTDEQKSQLQSQLFMKDSGDLATTNGKNGTNTGLILRRDFIKNSREFEMEGPLFEDIFSLDRHLIQGVDLYIKLYRSTDQFFVISGEDTPAIKLQLLDCVYKACKIKVDPGVIVNHLKQIETKPVRYYFQRTEVKRNTINKDSREFIWDNMLTLRPSTLVLGLISQESGNGTYGTNPFFFNHYNATDVGLYVNGESVPARPLKLDFGDNRQYATAYTNLFEVCEKLNKDVGLTITREDFGKGYTLYAFPLDPKGLGEDYINLVKHGNVRVEIKFKTGLPSAVTCIAFGVFDSFLEIDHSRNVRYIQS
ncbi:unnamed protein product [Mytilus coruscus]|uniref:Uncharacterized protein n=1 Tax=Mytilus coruscus TaxID=42192 RepID=A0A6J8D215_MYTCO|nr:unnamed protein product [Mytilus coruscus]